MALHEVQAVQPSKHARAFPLQRVPETSNGYITGPKMRSVTISQINLSSAVSDGQVRAKIPRYNLHLKLEAPSHSCRRKQCSHISLLMTWLPALCLKCKS